MTFIGRTLARTVVPFTPSTYDAAWPALNAGGLPSVTHDSAMALPAVYACTTVISEDIAKVPLQVFSVGDDGSKSVARNHPLYDLLHDEPNDYQDALAFREMMTAFALNRGVGVAEIIPGPRGAVDQLVPLAPDLVSEERVRDGKLTAYRYRYNDPVQGQRVLGPSEVFVLRGRFGRSVLSFARQNFSLQTAMQNYAAELYGRGVRTQGALSHPKTLGDPARERLRKALDEYAAGGEKAGRPLLLEEGMTWQSMALSMEDAEFLATLQHGVADVCRFYRVPQHKIQELLRSTNNNIEQQSVDYVTDSLVAWAVRWEQAIRRQLIIATTRFMAEHNLEGLLRGDIKSRFEAYAIAVSVGWMTPDEVRAKENMNPRGADELRVPLNMGNVPGTGVAFLPGGGTLSLLPGTSTPQPSSPTVVSYLRAMVRDGAARVVRKESAALAKLAERTSGSGDDWDAGVRVLYREHAEFVARVLRVPDEVAESYAAARCSRVLKAGPAALEDPELESIADLTETALARADVLQLPAVAA